MNDPHDADEEVDEAALLTHNLRGLAHLTKHVVFHNWQSRPSEGVSAYTTVDRTVFLDKVATVAEAVLPRVCS